MKKILLVASFALLASCSGKNDTAAAPDATESAAATTAVAATGPVPGDYDVTGPDGTKLVATLAADGTYVDHDPAGKELEKGTWAVKEGKTCFMPAGKAEVCYTDSAPAADGSFTATDAKGAVTQVKPHAK